MVLAHLYPEADVPVVQLSINALRPLSYQLAARLASLRGRGVMILASGNVVHNLGEVQWKRPDAAFDWAERFGDAVAAQLADAPGDILKLCEHPDYARPVPTPGRQGGGGEEIRRGAQGFQRRPDRPQISFRSRNFRVGTCRGSFAAASAGQLFEVPCGPCYRLSHVVREASSLSCPRRLPAHAPSGLGAPPLRLSVDGRPEARPQDPLAVPFP